MKQLKELALFIGKRRIVAPIRRQACHAQRCDIVPSRSSTLLGLEAPGIGIGTRAYGPDTECVSAGE
jgi:hypothetical protein